MRRKLRSSNLVLLGVLVGLLTVLGNATAATHYVMRLQLSEFTRDSLRLAFDFTSGNAATNTVRLSGFAHDGRTRYPVSQSGGPISGGLVETGLPPTATIRDQFFLNAVEIPLDSVGTQAIVSLELTEVGSPASEMPDELAFYVLNAGGSYLFPTVDPFGVNALFAIDVTGQSGGDLSVFAPMLFVPPDTLLLSNSTTGIATEPPLVGRLRFVTAGPNPFVGVIRLTYEVPAPGGLIRLRIFDVAGRLVAQPLRENRPPGRWSVVWDGTDRAGRLIATGSYLVQLQMGGQSVVRRIVLTR